MLRVLWVPARMFLFLLVLFIVWQVWVFSRPRPRDFTVAERAALESAMESAMGPVSARIAGRPSRFAVAHFVNDANGEATRAMQMLVERDRAWTLVQGSVIQEFLSGIGTAVIQATSLDEVVHAARRVEIDVVVTGRVVEVREKEGGAVASVQVHVFDARETETLSSGVYERDWQPGVMDRASEAVRRLPAVARLVIWLAVVLILPWGSARITHRTVAMKRNGASFALLLGYATLGTALALVFMGFEVRGAVGAVKVLAALVLSAAYSFWACERIAARG